MKTIATIVLFASLAVAQTHQFQRVIVLVQENRTPDNLFQGLCSTGNCAVPPGPGQYNIQTSNWYDNTSPTGVTAPGSLSLASAYDLGHDHKSWFAQCDLAGSECRMDGAAGVSCLPADTCAAQPHPAFQYVQSSDVGPYLTLAQSYGFGNYFFQTNQGPSFPAHQFLFGATSAPTDEDDAEGTQAGENAGGADGWSSCPAPANARVQLIDAFGVEDKHNTAFPCFEHATLSDLLEQQGISWKYYAPGVGGLWVAPAAIKHICGSNGTSCAGEDFVNNVDSKSADVLNDISNCNLRSVSWVVPTGNNSDHPRDTTGGGPSWVGSIVNAIGNSYNASKHKCDYWSDTAILITWDDWGGWYDHEPPLILPYPQGGDQLGFRVPLLAVSAYTPANTISNQVEDFGSIARFIEQNYGIAEGALGFADERSTADLTEYFSLTTARPFSKVQTKKNADFFINDTTPQSDPDDY